MTKVTSNPPGDSSADETRLGDAGSAVGSRPSSSSGWLSSSDDIDHGRFPPGTLLGGRYRIVGRLGRGGMGEVFRADDLKLGQPVALKFLPSDVDRDPARLTQLHTEVRMARQVSHPNVCRVYDIDEVEGHTFLSMEYVDGEDLSSLLRRIGRFPEERGLEIARQICAGLAAAHERGVVHRDFKPANVMIDGTGRARITDFGLAGLSGEAIRAGTPAYMAPEQLAGAEVTARSDIYALGLVLYEIFTGKRALDGKNLAELIHKREQSGILPPSALVPDLDDQTERAIMICLRPDPQDRPSSALAVSASLPGGDPLAAALAAGETPSPEMVAAAGTNQGVSARTALAGAAWVVLSLVALVVMYQRVMLINRIPSPKSPAALQDRAEEALNRLGYGGASTDQAFGLALSLDYARYIGSTSSEAERWSKLRGSRPETLVSWYRTSPRPLVPIGNENAIAGTNPPLNTSGMTLIVLDASGRLAEFIAVPQPIEQGEKDGAPATVNWAEVFAAAGLDFTAFHPVEPTWVPVTFADQRFAWEGQIPEHPGQTFKIESASYRGKPVSFVIAGPWSRSARSVRPQLTTTLAKVMNAFASLILPGLIVAAAVLARHNVKLGRGDRRGAFRAAMILFYVRIAAWLLAARYVGDMDAQIQRFFTAVGLSLLDAALLWITYLAVEPYIRKLSPGSLIGWTRLISGRWRDPHVGRDVLIGISAGLGMTLFYAVHNLIPPLFGRPEPMPMATADTDVLLGARFVLSRILSQFGGALLQGMLCVCGLVALMIPLKKKWAAHAVGSLLFVWAVVSGMFSPGTPVLDFVMGLGIIVIFIGVILHAGLLPTIAALTTHFMLLRAPLTTDLSSWRATAGITYLVILAAIGLAAAYLARTAQATGPRPTWQP
ncbi:MAG: serine/threonine-protein kinase [Vicinamibacterales bacterium]